MVASQRPAIRVHLFKHHLLLEVSVLQSSLSLAGSFLVERLAFPPESAQSEHLEGEVVVSLRTLGAIGRLRARDAQLNGQGMDSPGLLMRTCLGIP